MSPLICNLFGFLFCLLASGLIYIASPNQQWLEQKVHNRKLTFFCATASLVSAVLIFNLHFSALSAIFTVFTIIMLLLSTLPLVVRFEKPLTNDCSMTPWLKRGESYKSHQPQWWLKSIGVFFLCFPLAVLLCGFLGFSAGYAAPYDVRSQFIMWMITPIWLLPISLIFFSRRPWRVFAIVASLIPVFYGLLEWIK